MNNSELNSILRKARMPERPDDFWEFFPRRVINGLARNPSQFDGARADQPFLARWAWAFATAAGVLVALVALHWSGPPPAPDVLASVKMVDETLALFPHQVRAIVHDEHGLRLVLSEQSDVPASSPLYVKICDGTHCSSLVTFSGQEIQFAGQNLTVLSDSRGGIILEGNKLIWSSTGPSYADSHLRIEARNLAAAAL